jgi:hypothetical protein
MAEPQLVKQDCQRHQLGQFQTGVATPVDLAIRQKPLLPGRFKGDAKVIDLAKQFR